MNVSRFLVIMLAAAVAAPSATAISITQFNTAASENFDTLATTTSSVVPAGWKFAETGSGANTTYGAGTGSSSTGNTYSFGAAGSTERAFGTLRTTGVVSTIGTIIVNDTGHIITDLLIDYVGEQWRLGAIGRVDRLDFGFSLDATSLTTGSWSDVDALDFTAPVSAGTTGALNGNAAGNSTALSFTLTGLALADGATLWIRWTDFDSAGADDGLAIDNVSVTAVRPFGTPVPESLPVGMFAAVFVGLLALASQTRFRGAARLVARSASCR